MLEGTLRGIEAIEPAEVRPDPDKTSLVLEDDSDRVVGEAVGITGVVQIGLKAVPIVTIESTVGAKPEEPVVVLGNTLDLNPPRSLGGGDVGEANILPVQDGQIDEAAGERGWDYVLVPCTCPRGRESREGQGCQTR